MSIIIKANMPEDCSFASAKKITVSLITEISMSVDAERLVQK